MKILQINSTLNSGSTGRIVENIGLKLLERNQESVAAYGRQVNASMLKVVKIGSKIDQIAHVLNTRIFDTHGFHSRNSTIEFIDRIKAIEPSIIHLHNLHGYYLNIEILFKFFQQNEIPIVWTLHDSWSYTGHCSYYVRANCIKWKTECRKCPLSHLYPKTLIFDNSNRNFKDKRRIFNSIQNIHIVTVSNWLKKEVDSSFLKNHPIQVIYNGINLKIFRPLENYEFLKSKYNVTGKKIILGVANIWSSGKGLKSFLSLNNLISRNQHIILIGLSEKQLKMLPKNITGVKRTQDLEELAEYYNIADVFVNTSIAETFGLVTAEAMACGTPSVVYNSSATPELIDNSVGKIVELNNVEELNKNIQYVLNKGKEFYTKACREKAKKLFDQDKQIEKYINLYSKLIQKK